MNREIKFRVWNKNEKEWMAPTNGYGDWLLGFHSNGSVRFYDTNRGHP